MFDALLHFYLSLAVNIVFNDTRMQTDLAFKAVYSRQHIWLALELLEPGYI